MADLLTPDSNIETSTPQKLQKNTYKTRFNILSCIFFLVGIVLGGGTIIFINFNYIKRSDKNIIYIFLFIFAIMFTCVGGNLPLYISFHIDTYIEIIKVKTVKLFFCFNKSKKIQINDVQKIIIQKDVSVKYVINGKQVDAIEVIFKLNNESEIKGCSGVFNTNNECNKIYNFLRFSLPENILVEGN